MISNGESAFANRYVAPVGRPGPPALRRGPIEFQGRHGDSSSGNMPGQLDIELMNEYIEPIDLSHIDDIDS